MRVIRGMLLVFLVFFQSACGSEEGRALCEAIQTENLDAVRALIANGADGNENVTFEGSMTKPIRLAAMKLDPPNEIRESIAIAVLDAGGDPDLSWSFGGSSEGGKSYTIYALAVVARGGSVKAIEAFVKAGATVEGPPGGSALVAAARANHVDVLRLLADAGAPLNYMDDMNDTPLGAAVESGAREAIAFLDELGAREW